MLNAGLGKQYQFGPSLIQSLRDVLSDFSDVKVLTGYQISISLVVGLI